MTLRTRILRFLFRQRIAFEVLFRRENKRDCGITTADWHQPIEPSHPSLLCRCPGGPDDAVHFDDCEWLKARCRTCEGNGYCPGCAGDGVDRDVEEHRR